MSHSRPDARRSWSRSALIAVLALVSLGLAGLIAREVLRLRAMGVPWAYAGATLDPKYLATVTSPPTDTPRPTPTATSTPLPTPTPPPTETPGPLPLNFVPAGKPCASDFLAIKQIQPRTAGRITIGRGDMSVTVSFCLAGAQGAVLIIGLASQGVYQASLTPGQLIPFGPINYVAKGDGQVAQALDWRVARWSPANVGNYRLAILLVESLNRVPNSFQDLNGRILASVLYGSYAFHAP